MTFFRPNYNYGTSTLGNILGGVERKEPKPSGVAFPCLTVWAASAAADRINNGEYLKEPRHDTQGNLVAKPNRLLIKELCENPEEITEEDRTQGRELHDYVRGWTLKLLDPNCNDFIKTAVKFVDVETIDAINLGVIACLPSSINRDREFERVRRDIDALMTKGVINIQPGKGIQGDMEIMQTFPSKRYEGFVVRGNLDGYFVWFFSSTAFIKGNKYTIKARIKGHGSKTGTQLNYVKIIKP